MTPCNSLAAPRKRYRNTSGSLWGSPNHECALYRFECIQPLHCKVLGTSAHGTHQAPLHQLLLVASSMLQHRQGCHKVSEVCSSPVARHLRLTARHQLRLQCPDRRMFPCRVRKCKGFGLNLNMKVFCIQGQIVWAQRIGARSSWVLGRSALA